MKKIFCIILIIIMTVSVTACIPERAITEYTVKSTQSDLKMDFHYTWVEMDFDEEATIEMGLKEKNWCMKVIESPVDESTKGLRIDQIRNYLEQLNNFFQETLTAKSGEIVGNGSSWGTIENISGVSVKEFDAKFFEIKVKYDEEQIDYYIFCCTYNDIFYQIYCWSPHSTFDEAFISFGKVIKTMDFS